MSVNNQVLAASEKFYDALNKMAAGDAAPMSSVWVTDASVSAHHPIGGRDQGYDAVIASFTKVSEIASGGEIRLKDQQIVAGTDMALETGVEVGKLVIAGHTAAIDHRVTNVYLLVGGTWKLAHHHTDQSEAMLEILKKLT
ncbi:nuclear transport factor 2 family protein [Hoeflea sp. CAU 1731]